MSCVRTGVRNLQMYSKEGRCDYDYEYAALCVRVHIEHMDGPPPPPPAMRIGAEEDAGTDGGDIAHITSTDVEVAKEDRRVVRVEEEEEKDN